MTGINLLHVSAPGCHSQRFFQISGIHYTARHTSHFASFIWTLSLFFLLALQPIVGLYFVALWRGYSLLAYELSWSHTTTHHSRQDSSGRVISPSQRPLPDNTRQSQQTNIHAPGGIRTHDSRNAIPTDHKYRDRRLCTYCIQNIKSYKLVSGTAHYHIMLYHNTVILSLSNLRILQF